MSAPAAIRVFVQARMSSRRFPGKVLAALAGRPLIAHVVERCGAAFGSEAVVVATSVEGSDDPLAHYLKQQGVALFRGDLDNVLRRFQQCLAQHPCDWFVRISADSPLIDPRLIVHVAGQRAPDLDLVSNVFQTRTYPAGQSVEVVRAQRFAEIDSERLAADEREHVTLAYYRSPDKYRIRGVVSGDANLPRQPMTVDTPEDLQRVEALMMARTR